MARNSVATPNATHYEITKAFLEAGFNVLCEKPMTVTVEEAEDIGRAELVERLEPHLKLAFHRAGLDPFLAVAGLFGYLVVQPAFRAAVGRSILRIPAIGRQMQTYQLARLYRTVGMLLRGGIPAVTAEMTIKFKAPAAPDQELTVSGRILQDTRRLILAEAKIHRGIIVVAEATGKLLRISS